MSYMSKDLSLEVVPGWFATVFSQDGERGSIWSSACIFNFIWKDKYFSVYIDPYVWEGFDVHGHLMYTCSSINESIIRKVVGFFPSEGERVFLG